MITHRPGMGGTPTGYREGCRCDECREWKSADNRKYRGADDQPSPRPSRPSRSRSSPKPSRPSTPNSQPCDICGRPAPVTATTSGQLRARCPSCTRGRSKRQHHRVTPAAPVVEPAAPVEPTRPTFARMLREAFPNLAPLGQRAQLGQPSQPGPRGIVIRHAGPRRGQCQTYLDGEGPCSAAVEHPSISGVAHLMIDGYPSCARHFEIVSGIYPERVEFWKPVYPVS